MTYTLYRVSLLELYRYINQGPSVPKSETMWECKRCGDVVLKCNRVNHIRRFHKDIYQGLFIPNRKTWIAGHSRGGGE